MPIWIYMCIPVCIWYVCVYGMCVQLSSWSSSFTEPMMWIMFKCICNPRPILRALCGPSRTGTEQWKSCHPTRTFLAAFRQGDAAVVLQLSDYKRVSFSRSIFNVPHFLFTFLCFCWWFYCPEWPPSIWRVSEHKKTVRCPTKQSMGVR